MYLGFIVILLRQNRKMSNNTLQINALHLKVTLVTAHVREHTYKSLAEQQRERERGMCGGFALSWSQLDTVSICDSGISLTTPSTLSPALGFIQ